MDIGPEATWQEDTPARVLRGAARDLAAAEGFDHVMATTARWSAVAVGAGAIAIRVALPDPAGRLTVNHVDGRWPRTRRVHAERRRQVFRGGSAMTIPLREPAGWAIGMVPLLAGEVPVGVLEVAGPERPLADALDVLDALASQAALALTSLEREAHLRSQVGALASGVALSLELMQARSPGSALRAAVRFHAQLHGGPVAAWLAEGDPPRLRLTALSGVGSRTRGALRSGFGDLPSWSSISQLERRRLVSRLEGVLGLPDVMVVGSDEMLLLAGRAQGSTKVAPDLVGSLLSEVLRHLTAAARAERRSAQLDRGLAWTAHELRGPLLGVKAVLEFLQHEEGSASSRAMLRRSQRELEQLASLTDGLLRWSAGAEPLRKRWEDVIAVVGEAVESCRLEVGEDRVTIDAPDTAMAWVDGTHLRLAIANVVRNALTYSPRASEVQVRVDRGDGSVRIRVHDDGPGVSRTELAHIFDPFVRGDAGRRATRDGTGLGLFIARRIVDAHDGRIALEPSTEGATFTIEVPVGRGGGRGEPP